MSTTTHSISLADYSDGFAVDVQPPRITNGGIAVVTASVDGAQDGTYTATWVVEGPVPLSDDEMRVVLLGATIVSGGQVELSSGNSTAVFRATLDTAPLSVGSWQVGLVLTQVVEEGAQP